MKPQTFALITAGVVGSTGLMGLAQSVFQSDTQNGDVKLFTPETDRIAGLVPTNTAFNWLRIGIGAAGLFAAQNEESARIYNRTVAVSYAAMGVMGLFEATDTCFGTLPLYGANVVLHAGIAAAELLAEDELTDRARESLPTLAEAKAKLAQYLPTTGSEQANA